MLWNCAALARNVRDCAFVGLDIEGRDNSPAQLGLAYLAEMPTTEPTLLTGPLRSLKEKIGCQLRYIAIKGGEQGDGRRGRKKHLPCQFANKNTEADAFEVESVLVDWLSDWKARSGKKLLVLVGFSVAMELQALLSQWPRAIRHLDGWLDARDLAQERAATATTGRGGKGSFTSLHLCLLGLGIQDVYLRSHNAAADALMALVLLLAIWDSLLQKRMLQSVTTDRPGRPRPRNRRRHDLGYGTDFVVSY
ncbi:hypothetical protein PG988_011580 [Apiospora saccharicola]